MLSTLLVLMLQAADDQIDFKRDIRPILSNACFLCHGPDDKGRKGELRLDTRDGAFKTKDGVTPIVPGKPDQSELIKRITTADKDDLMPPPKSGKKLTAKQIDLLRKWIQQGAKWGEHWSFVAPERSPAPPVKGKEWVRTPVDAFILARLERENFPPSPS